jgi:hypothetical protein
MATKILEESVTSIFKVKVKSTLKTEAVGSSETLITLYKTNKHQILYDNGPKYSFVVFLPYLLL